jgi:predicted O-methyltransferase YrrM
MRLRPTFRRLALGLSTILGLRRAGWFIPYRYANSLPVAGTVPAYAAVATLLEQATPRFLAMVDAIDAQADAFRDIVARSKATAGPPPRFDQGWFPTLDAAVAYTLVRDRRPRRIVEVGSGHSTRFLARAVVDGGASCDILAIDPAPRADIAELPNVRLMRQPVHTVELARWPLLEPGDMLFIDSSHVLMPGSDVDFLFNRILPTLAPGVLLHIHDIFLPYDYPAEWAWRAYNEQQAVVPLLTSGAWAAVFASHFALQHIRDRLAHSAIAHLPQIPDTWPASLWLERQHG